MELLHAWCVIFIFFHITQRVAVTPVIGGQLVVPSDGAHLFPFMVSLQDPLEHSDQPAEYRHFCGGSLITSRWILTAAHCTWRKNITTIVAVIGLYDLSSASHLDHYGIDRVEYLYFQPINYRNDIALLRMRTAYVPLRSPGLEADIFARLPKYGMKANRNNPCKIVGYGAKHYAGEAQNHLIEGEAYVITKRKCRSIIGSVWGPQNGENTICALGKNQDTCQGDSGGPLICSYNGRDYIYGIVSHGLSCGHAPSIYTVTIPYLEWINLIVKE